MEEAAIMQAPYKSNRASWDERLIQGVLRATRFLRGAAPGQMAAFARQCWSLEARRGLVILPKGARPPGAFAVAHGIVKLALRQSEADERVVRLVQAGQTFGESTALLGRAAPFEASAVNDCKLVVIPSAAVFGLVERDPRVAREILSVLAERNLELLAELEASSMNGGSQRLASYLGSLVSTADGRGRRVVRLPATKTVIASRLGMKKETLSRLLRSFAERGLIQVTQREIGILDPEKLAQLAAIAGQGA